MDEDDRPNAATSEKRFALLWDDMVDLLGSSATATLLRRAAKHVASQQPTLRELVIHKPAFDYEYTVPPAWKNDGRDTLALLVRALVPLLRELTGPIVIQRLRSIPELAQAQLLVDEAEDEGRDA